MEKKKEAIQLLTESGWFLIDSSFDSPEVDPILAIY